MSIFYRTYPKNTIHTRVDHVIIAALMAELSVGAEDLLSPFHR